MVPQLTNEALTSLGAVRHLLKNVIGSIPPTDCPPMVRVNGGQGGLSPEN
jgi:hypothetical protein